MNFTPLVYVGLGVLAAASFEALTQDQVVNAVTTSPASSSATIPTVPDIACGGAPTGKPALNFDINGKTFLAEFDSGASFALMTPPTATAVGLQSLPRGPQQDIAFSNQAPGTFSTFIAPVSVAGLPPITIPIATGQSISCNLIPTLPFEQLYTVGLSTKSVTFTKV